LGLGAGIYYFLPVEKERVRGLVVEGMIVLFLMGCLYAVFISLGGNHLLAKRFSNPAIVNTLVYLIPLPLIMLPASLVSSVLVIRERVNQLTVYNVLSNLVLATGLIGVCLVWKSPGAIVLTKVAVLCVTGLVGIALVFQSLPHDSWKPNWASTRRIIGFSVPLMTASVIGTFSMQMDHLIVSSMCAPEEYAVYAIGAMEIPVIGIVTGAVMAVIMPDLRQMVELGKFDTAIRLFRVAATKTSMLLIPLMVILFVCASPLITTLFSEKYLESVAPFRWYLLMIPMRFVVFGSFLTAVGLNRLILIRTCVGLVVNLILSVILVSQIGYIGAIMGTLLSLYFVEGLWCIFAIGKATETKFRHVLPFQHFATLFAISLFSSIPAILLLWQFQTSSHPLVLLFLAATSFFVCLIGASWLCRFQSLNNEISYWSSRIMRRLVPKSALGR
jgi:O-antigen/teichoic acid export membrane protein